MEALESFHREWRELREQVHTLRQKVEQLEDQLARRRPAPQLLTTRQFCQEYGWTMGRLREKLFHRKSYGLEGAVHQRSKGGLLYIDPQAFFDALKRTGRLRRR